MLNFPTEKVEFAVLIPGADHVLAQSLQRCGASHIDPNETLELAKKRQNILCFGVCGRMNFFTLSPSYKQSPKNREKSLCSTVLQLRWVISTWWDENVTLCVFSACYEIHWDSFCGRKQTKMQRSEEEPFFVKGALVGKSIFQIQRIKAVHGTCSSSDVLRDIPSNFTRGVRRRIVL